MADTRLLQLALIVLASTAAGGLSVDERSASALPVVVCTQGFWRHQGVLIRLSSTDELLIRTGEDNRAFARGDVMGFRITDGIRQAVDPDPHAVWVRFTNHDLWRAERVRIEEEQIHIRHAMLGDWSFPLGKVATLSIGEPDVLRYTELGDSLRADRSAGWDRVQLRDGQVVEGIIVSLEAGHVVLEKRLGELRLPISRIRNIHLTAPDVLADPKPPPVMVDLVDGTRASFGSMHYLEGRDSPGHFDIENAPHGRARISGQKVRAVWHRNSTWQWLGELEPAILDGRSMLGEVWPIARDRCVSGDPMLVGGRVFTRGLGMHATSRAVWKLEEPFTRLRGAVALDDSAHPHGRVDVRILVDGVIRFSIDHLEPGMTPATFDLALSHGATLELVAEAGPEGEIQDRVNWLDMFLIRDSDSVTTQTP